MRWLLFFAACSWADPITRHAPDPAGPCLQIVHPQRHVWQLFRDGKLVGPNERAQYEAAMSDHPPSLRRIRRSAVKDPTTSTALSSIGLGGFAFPSLLVAGILVGLADKDQGDAVGEYNRRGCL